MRRLGYSRGPLPKKPRLGMLPKRRIGRAKAFDVFDNSDGSIVVRNVTADQVVATYCPSLTAEGVISGVAEWHHIDADGYRVAAHFSIAGMI
jgi:hypothetical protein